MQVTSTAAASGPSGPRVHPAPPYASDPGRRGSQPLPPIDDNKTYDAEQAYGGNAKAKGAKVGWASFKDEETATLAASKAKR